MQIVRQYVAAIVESVRSSAIARRGLVTIVLLLLAAPFIAWGAGRGIQSMFNAPLRWIPRSSASRQQFNEFLEMFGSHEMVAVSWPGCHVDDEQLCHVASVLQRARDRRSASGKEALFNHVLTGYSMLKLLTAQPIDLSRAVALARMQGVLVGPDGKTSCVVVEVTDYGAENRRETMRIITDAVTEATGLTDESLVFAGPPVDGIAIDDESIRSIQTYSLPSILLSLILCWFCLRSLWLTAPILMIGAVGQGLMLALVYYGGDTMNAILIVLPPLIFVLTVSAGVHLANYFLEELRSGSVADAPRRALLKARGPITLAAVTTAIGLASLCVSEVDPVRQFGILGAIGLLICVGLLFLLVPGFMVVWVKRLTAANTPARGSADARRTGTRFANVVWRHGLAIRVISSATLIFCGIGLARLRTKIDVVSLLSADNPAVRNFRWFEQHIGPLVPVELVIHFDHECPLTTVDRLKVVSAVQRKISQIEILEGDMSAVTFIPRFPRGGGLRGTVRQTLFRRQVERSRDDLIAAKYLAETEKGEAWRISGRIVGQVDFDYGQFLDRLREKVDPILAKLEASGHSGVTSICTGVTAVVYQVQEKLLGDLFNSFLTALLLVAIVMMIALRSVTCGLLAMMPNVFPTILVFGCMGWTDRALDIGSVMTASVALGIAVDGTFHYLKWFVHSLKQGESRQVAIAIAYQRCGRALVQTTIICASGLLIFTFSGFLPARNFAWMLLMMLVVALFGDLVLLPALLAGSLGRILSRICRPPDGVLTTAETTTTLTQNIKTV